MVVLSDSEGRGVHAENLVYGLSIHNEVTRAEDNPSMFKI